MRHRERIPDLAVVDSRTLFGPADAANAIGAPGNQPGAGADVGDAVRDSVKGVPVPPRRGWWRPFSGRAPKAPDVPTFRGSTAQVQGLYPWLYGASMPASGAYIGVDCLSGAAFSGHPIEWLLSGLISNPNILLTGVPGSGKSALIKALALRLMPYGVRTFVLGDIKNEYAVLARALGVQPLELGPGLPARLNPLDAGPLGANLPTDPQARRERLEEIHRRRIGLLASLLVMRLGRDLSPTEEAALSLAIQHATWMPGDGLGRHAAPPFATGPIDQTLTWPTSGPMSGPIPGIPTDPYYGLPTGPATGPMTGPMSVPTTGPYPGPPGALFSSPQPVFPPLAYRGAHPGEPPAAQVGSSAQLGPGEVMPDPTIPQVWQLLRDPTEQMARQLRIRGNDVEELREMIRPISDALGNMIHGSLSGLFDGPTTVAMDFTAPIQTVDLSRLDGRGDETVAMTLACVSSWGQAAIDDPAGGVRLVVRDELWRAMRIPAMIRKLDSDLRLSRAQGTIQVLATHRLADFEAVGPADSAEVAIASNLISSCDVRICLRQDTAPLAMTRDAIGLTDTEAAHIASWSGEQRGRAVWKIGRSASHVVQTVLHPAEQHLFWTNERMAL